MYLHLGGDIVINDKYVLGVFDLDNTSTSKITREFLDNVQKDGKVTNVTHELPRSFVVTCDDTGVTEVYICQVAPATLKKRAIEVE